MGLFDDAPMAKRGLFDDAPDAPRKDPKLGQPEELSFAEKYLAPVLERFSETAPGSALRMGNGNLRGSAVGGAMMGAADPGVALVQMAANAVGQGDVVNKRIQEVEGQYQDARKGAGRDGVDLARVAGNVAITAPIGFGPGGVLKSAAVGGLSGVLDPITDGADDFWSRKAEQGGIGAVTGAALSPLMRGLARIVSPNASTNAELKLLREEGVKPSIGQALGGWANTAEEKLASAPILGDMIAKARRGAVEDFNQAAINRAVEPIGRTVKGSGSAAVKEAGDHLSAAYTDAAERVGHINFDTPTFNKSLFDLQSLVGRAGWPDNLVAKFNNTLDDVVLRRMSPNGSIAGADLKVVDSELGKIANKFRNAQGVEGEFGDAVRQLQANIREGMRAGSPEYKMVKDAADSGWKQLVRVEDAAARASNQGGVFTPAQLGASVRKMDGSARKRAVARGDATMQDLADAAQSVLGNKVPDSGTAGRMLTNIFGMSAAAAAHPAIPVALTAGSALYTRPVQNALVELVTRRPDMAPRVANYLRQIAGPASVAAVPLAQEFR